MTRLLLAAAVLLTVVSTAHAQAPPTFQKVMIVVLENTDYANALAQPFLSDLAARGALLSNFFAETHPSFPNYVAMTAGSTFGLSSNDDITLDVSHIGDLLEAAGRTWKVYAEGYPGNCFLGSTAGAYVRRHVPFLSFRNVQTNPARCQQVVNAAVLATDIANGTLPDYGFYVPDLNNDGHDTGVAFADHWLAQTFGPWLEDPRFMDGMLFVVTFDEGSSSGANHIYTVLYGRAVVPGSVSASRYDHYSLLRTIEDAWSLGTLGQQDAEASAITEVWRRTHTLTVTSVNPSAVAATVTPMDLDGLSDATTPFNRIYDHNALVNLTAPITAQSTTFQQWRRDGVDVSTSASVQITMDADHGLTAVYGPVSFVDVSPGQVFWPWIEALVHAGITAGCATNPPMYCPDQTVTRAQMAVFILRGIHGAFIPPAASGIFADVPTSHPLAAWIEQLFAEAITGGCGTNPPRYCPDQSVTRGQTAVFLLRSKHGASYQPSAATGLFADVSPTDPLAPWIEQLFAEGITAGCGTTPLRYCPDQSVTRGQMAVFLVRAFGLPL